MEKITDGFNLIEGPVWDNKLGLVFSDAGFERPDVRPVVLSN